MEERIDELREGVNKLESKHLQILVDTGIRISYGRVESLQVIYLRFRIRAAVRNTDQIFTVLKQLEHLKANRFDCVKIYYLPKLTLELYQHIVNLSS